MSTVRELAAKRGRSLESNASMLESRDRLFRHMYDISGDPSGSRPEDYFDEKDLEELSEFFQIATELQWVDAEAVIDMRRSRVPGLEAFPNSKRVGTAGLARAGLTRVLFFPRIEPAQRGYVGLKLNMQPTQLVAVCQKDHLLRSWRGPELAGGSKAMGWGRLPDPDYMQAYIKPAERLIVGHDRRKSIAENLVSCILPTHLRSIQ